MEIIFRKDLLFLYFTCKRIKVLIASARHHFFCLGIFFRLSHLSQQFWHFYCFFNTILYIAALFFFLPLPVLNYGGKRARKQSKIICLHKWKCVAYQLRFEFALPLQKDCGSHLPVRLTFLPHLSLSSSLPPIPYAHHYKFTAGIIPWDNTVLCWHKIFSIRS